MPEMSFVIVSYNTREVLKECINAIYCFLNDMDVEVIVVDNASTDGTQGCIKENFTKVILLENEYNLGYAKAVNIGLTKVSGKYTVILNSDVILTGSFDKWIRMMDEDPSIGISGCKIMGEDGELQINLKKFPSFFLELYKLTLHTLKDLRCFLPYARERSASIQEPAATDWVEGCCMLARTEILKKIGGMDERYFLYYEDIDLCRTIKKQLGLRVVYCPFIKVRHLGGESTCFDGGKRLDMYYKSSIRYFRKNEGVVMAFMLEFLVKCGWVVMFALLYVPSLIFRQGKISGKKDMIGYAIRA